VLFIVGCFIGMNSPEVSIDEILLKATNISIDLTGTNSP
jgi:hypothetical protein